MGTAKRKRQSVNEATSPEATAAPVLESVPLACEIVIARSDLRRALSPITKVADKRAALPILGHVAICTDGSHVTLTATDLDARLSVRLPCSKPSRNAAIVVSAHELAEIVRTLPDADVVLRPDGNVVDLVCGAVRSRLAGAAHADFPAAPKLGDATFTAIDGAPLREAIALVASFASQDSTRRNINGVFIESDGATFVAVATDGHRISVARREWTGPVIAGVVLTASGVDAMTRFAAHELAMSAHHVFLRGPSGELAVKIVDETFPSYRQVIPQTIGTLATLDRASLVSTLDRAKLCCRGKRGRSITRGATLSLDDGMLTVHANDGDGKTVTERITADFARSAKVGINPHYLHEALSAISDASVTITIGEELDPIVVRSTTDAAMRPLMESSLLTVIMPMRL